MVLDGQDLRKQSRSDIARRMAILMTARMNPELMSCRDVVSSGRYPYTGRLGVLRAEDKQIVEGKPSGRPDALDFADKPFRAVSDGQRPADFAGTRTVPAAGADRPRRADKLSRYPLQA